MKKAISLLLVLVLCLSLCACGKSESVKNVEAMINAIGQVSLDNESAVVGAEKAYAALTAEEKDTVENHTVLSDARTALDLLIQERQEKMKYVGEWVYISNSSRDSIIVLEDNTWKDSRGASGTWLLDENGLLINEFSPYAWAYEEYNSIPRLTQTIETVQTVLVKKEYASFAEYEINIDNWQEYFEYKRIYAPNYDPFGELDSYIYIHWLSLKPEFAERLVYETNEEFNIAIEFSGTLSKAHGKIDSETGRFTVEYFAEDFLSQYSPKGTLYAWDLTHFTLDSIYMPTHHHYDNPLNPPYSEYGSLTEHGATLEGYLDNRGIGRIQGSILLYEYPVHKMPDYADALAQFDDSEIVFAPKTDIPENGTTYTVSSIASLNIRVAPSSDSSIVGQYKSGEKIIVFEQKDGWGRTDKGWVMMKYVK